MNTSSDAATRRFRKHLIRRAIDTNALLLAAALARYAEAEGIDWRALAESLGGTTEALDRIALCRPPRSTQFVTDVEAIAAGEVDADRLLSLLRRIQVIEALSTETHSPYVASDDAARMLLAARDREDAPASADLDISEPDDV